MTTTTGPGEGVLTLFGDTQPAAPHPRGRGTRPDPVSQDPDTGAAENAEAFDPSRWVMVGWRNARGALPVTWQQLAAVVGDTQGPCARCGTPHHRYGEGGGPLCPACRTPSVTEE